MYSGLHTSRLRQGNLDSFTPVGLHVLVVDDDPLCLKVLDRMLKQCNYKVTTSNRVKDALELLREEDNNFDIVISDVYMPDEDGFKLLEVIGLELDLPVIMISANRDFSVVMKGIIHGACDYLIKPVRIEELQNIWQHVIRRKNKDFFKSELQGESEMDVQMSEDEKELYRESKEVLELDEFCADNISGCARKARVNWSVQLHRQFVEAVNQLGIERAMPKKILEIMNVQGLSRENVASHLQKYRLYLKRLSGVIHEPLPVASFQAAENGGPGGSMLIRTGRRNADPAAPVKGRNLGAGLGSKVGKMKKVDPGTLKSLSQLKSLQQKQAANRAQVLSAIGVGERSCSGSSSHGGLFRMASLDVSLLLQAKDEALSPAVSSAKGVDDLAMRSVSRSVKLEDDIAFPGASPVQCMYDVSSQSIRDGLLVHASPIESRMGSVIVDQCKLNRDIPHQATEYQSDQMRSNINQVCSADYSLAHGMQSSPYMAAFQADVKDSPMSELNNSDYGQQKLQSVEKATREVASSVRATTFDTNNSMKQSYEVSAGSMATEMSGETFSDCSVETLLNDFDMMPLTQHFMLRRVSSELLDVDDYLQLE